MKTLHRSSNSQTFNDDQKQEEEVSRNINASFQPINSTFTAFPILLHRSLTNGIRQPALFCNRITQSLFGLILACFFAPCDQDTQASIQNRIGLLLYNLTVANFIGMLTCVAAFPQEKQGHQLYYVLLLLA
jgi:hypothetical protein